MPSQPGRRETLGRAATDVPPEFLPFFQTVLGMGKEFGSVRASLLTSGLAPGVRYPCIDFASQRDALRFVGQLTALLDRDMMASLYPLAGRQLDDETFLLVFMGVPATAASLH